MGVAFIVDGQLEKRVVQRLCNSAPVRVTNMNGRNVEISAIAKLICSFLDLFRGRYFPVVIVIDREARDQSSEQIEAEIKVRVSEYGHDVQGIIVSCADRMIENWIISGTSSYRGHDISCELMDHGDGCNGKSIVRQILGGCNVTYSETTVGVDLFCSMDFEKAAGRSESFNRFRSQMSDYCLHLRQIR
ncbi:MAG: hypothetical protein O9972_34510 [Burkholderiales bacterium]|nr:hypothetical protein [Burkholderiales bacterium]